MTDANLPSNPSVLNTTVLSNFAYLDQVEIVAGLSGICTVPFVRDELRRGVKGHSYLQSALNVLDDGIPVAPISDPVATRESVLSDHLDPGEAQAFVLADVHDGRLLTDDGDARSFAKAQGVTVVGSVGVLLPRLMREESMRKPLMNGSRRGLMRSTTMFHIRIYRNINTINRPDRKSLFLSSTLPSVEFRRQTLSRSS
jgi:predicted nucleic acid-binding protein